MKARMLLLAAPVCLVLGVFATAQQASVTPLRDTPYIKPTLQTEPWIHLPNMPQAPPPTVNNGWVKLPNLNQAPPPGVLKGEASSYCVSTLNSSGFASQMDYEGSLSCVANDTCLHAFRCPSYTFGLFIYGNQQAQIPMGNGYLCVSPFNELYRLSPAVAATRGGQAEFELNLHRTPLGGAITPGSTWNFQYWFRDPLVGGAGWNFSDGLRITFGP